MALGKGPHGRGSLDREPAEGDPLWTHLAARDTAARVWMERGLPRLDAHTLDALLDPETRPRAEPAAGGVLVLLRGVNTNPGREPEDMASLRLWADEAGIVTLSVQDLASVAETRTEIEAGCGPTTPGALIAVLVERLTARIEGFLREIDTRVVDLEADVLDEPDAELRQGISDVRRDVIAVRRFTAPQRDAVGWLAGFDGPPLDDRDRRRLAEAHDDLTRAVEELDALRDRLAVVRDELASSLSDRLNSHLYFLALVSAVFLPLGFLTGLMGINLAGMPGAAWGPAFWVFAGLCAAILTLQVLILRRLRWF